MTYRNRKVNDEQVRQIKIKLAQGILVKKIAVEFGISCTTVSLIKSGARRGALK